MPDGSLSQHLLAAEVPDGVRHDFGGVLHDVHLWVPGIDYFGPVWIGGVGWVVPQGWGPPHGWAPPPGWYQPAYWDQDDYRQWCHDHYSSDHDWRGWENRYHRGAHNQWHSWNDHNRDDGDHRGWNDHDRDDRDHRQDNGHGRHADRDQDRHHNGVRQVDQVRHLGGPQHQVGSDPRAHLERDPQRGIDNDRPGDGMQRGELSYHQHGPSYGTWQYGPANSVAPAASTFSAPAPSFASGALTNGASVSLSMAPVRAHRPSRPPLPRGRSRPSMPRRLTRSLRRTLLLSR
jgi:hypothetical protein